MQQVSQNPRLLLETSVFMVNTRRISNDVWTARMCQNLLIQATSTYNKVLDNIIFAGYPFSEPADKKGDEDRQYLLICLLRETLNSFLVKWEGKFFNRKGRSRFYVPKKHRYNLQRDFLAIQEVVAELCDTLKSEPEKEEVPEKKNDKKSKDGYN